MSRPPIPALAAWLTTAVLAAGLGACGSSSSSTASRSNAAGATGAPSAAQFQARLNLAKCLRAHAVDVPDPTTASSHYGRALLRIARNYPQAQLKAAEQACRQYLFQGFPQLALSPAQQAQRIQQEVQYAECMRSHGINIPDPNRTSPATGLALLLSSVDRSSPAFKAANAACASLRPKRRDAAGGAPSTSG